MSVYARLTKPASRLALSTTVSARAAFARQSVAALRAATIVARSMGATAVKEVRRLNPDIVEEPDLALETEVEAKEAPIPFKDVQDSIHPDTYKAITEAPYKYKHMSPVQAAVLDMLPELAAPYNPHAGKSHGAEGSTKGPAAQNRDLLVRAKTGTGKTIAFLVPAIEARLNALAAAGLSAEKESGAKWNGKSLRTAEENYARDHVGTLIISPTRELAVQIATEANNLLMHHRHNVHLFVGGESKGRQMGNFDRRRRDVVVATPGRLMDLMDNEPDFEEAFQNINTLVLDEADTLLDMGFRRDIESIIQRLPPTPKRQTFLFSATVSREIRDIARKSLDKNHTFINCVKEDDSPVHEHIPQFVTVLPSPADQIPHVMNLIAQDQLQHPGKSKVMVFCNTTNMTAMLGSMLHDLRTALPQPKTQVYELHSKITQNSRRRRSDQFRNDATGASVLITSDVSARGVDYPNVTRVIQIGAPSTPDVYIHRVGRTGRGSNLTGRGDLVLLPFEAKYPARELAGLPLKKIDTQKVIDENHAFAATCDADPRSFFKHIDLSPPKPPARSSRFGRNAREDTFVQRPRAFPSNVEERMGRMKEVIEETVANQPEDEKVQTFNSFAGYYLALADSMGFRDNRELFEHLQEMHRGVFKEEPPTPSATIRSLYSLDKVGRGGRARSSSRGWKDDEGRDGERRKSFSRSDRPRSFDRNDRPRSFDRNDRPRSFDRNDRPKSFDRNDRPRSYDRDSRPPRSFGDRPSYGRPSDRGSRSNDESRSFKRRQEAED